MLNGQTVAISFCHSERVLCPEALGGLAHVYSGPGGPSGKVEVYCGSNVFHEQDETHLIIAIGDVGITTWRSIDEVISSGKHIAVVSLDKLTGEVELLTDRINQFKLFCWDEDGQTLALASSPRQFRTELSPVDPVGIACYLANGAQLFGHTPWSAIRILPGAHRFALDRGKVEGEAYWRFSMQPEPGMKNALGKLQAELKSAIISQSNGTRVLLSLSGGRVRLKRHTWRVGQRGSWSQA